jgi:hypothetical protein
MVFPSPASQATTPPKNSTDAPPSSLPTTAIRDCQGTNGTQYVSTQYNSDRLDSPSDAGLSFKRYCNTTQNGDDLMQSYVVTFNDCIEICAWLNSNYGADHCQGVTFCPSKHRPGNCWAHSGTNLTSPSKNAFCHTAIADNAVTE